MVVVNSRSGRNGVPGRRKGSRGRGYPLLPTRVVSEEVCKDLEVVERPYVEVEVRGQSDQEQVGRQPPFPHDERNCPVCLDLRRVLGRPYVRSRQYGLVVGQLDFLWAHSHSFLGHTSLEVLG